MTMLPALLNHTFSNIYNTNLYFVRYQQNLVQNIDKTAKYLIVVRGAL